MIGTGTSTQYTQRPMNLFSSCLEFILPTLCIVCEQSQAKIICNTCLTHLTHHSLYRKPQCSVCALIVPDSIQNSTLTCHTCLLAHPAFDKTICLDSYHGPLRQALHALKYHKRLACAAGLAYARNKLHQKISIECSAEVLIPMPISTARLATRGFNQAWEIARLMKLPKHVKKVANFIGRKETSYSQALQRRNMRAELSPKEFYFKTNDARSIRDKHILIVDDVMTTGQTMHALAQFLKENGANRVSVWTILRTLPRVNTSAI